MLDESKIEPYGGFSIVRIILSDALPASAFHPDFPDYTPKPYSRQAAEGKDGSSGPS